MPRGNSVTSFPDSLLERYFQWGQYDSLALGVESRLGQTADKSLADGNLLAWRGVALFNSGRLAEAREHFRLGLCRNPAALDAHYLTRDMQTLYREVQAALAEGKAGCDIGRTVSAPGTPPDSPAVLSGESPAHASDLPAAPPAPDSRRPASTKTWLAWSAITGAVLMAGAAMWEFHGAADVYATMEEAAQAGDLEYYRRRKPGWEREISDHHRNAWIAAGGALVLAGTGGLLVWKGRRARLALSPPPGPRLALAWGF